MSSESPESPAPARPGRKYLLVSPCRNEAEFLRRTLDSVCGQTVPPTKWVIVDDGSTDETPQILAEYAARFDFIEVIEKPDRGGRSVGPGVIETFYYGYEAKGLNTVKTACESSSVSTWKDLP